jgi:hypothetical protein
LVARAPAFSTRFVAHACRFRTDADDNGVKRLDRAVPPEVPMITVIRATIVDAARAAGVVVLALPVVWLHIVKSVLSPADLASSPPVAEETDPPRWRTDLVRSR